MNVAGSDWTPLHKKKSHVRGISMEYIYGIFDMLHTVPIYLFYALYHGAFVCDLDTANQLLFAATLLLHVISEIHRFALTIFRD